MVGDGGGDGRGTGGGFLAPCTDLNWNVEKKDTF